MSDLGKAARKLASKGRLEWPHPQFGPPGLHTKRTHRHLTWLFIFNARDTLAKHIICTKRQSFILSYCHNSAWWFRWRNVEGFFEGPYLTCFWRTTSILSRGVAAAEASVMCEEKCFNEFDEGRTNGARGKKKEEEDDFYLQPCVASQPNKMWRKDLKNYRFLVPNSFPLRLLVAEVSCCW